MYNLPDIQYAPRVQAAKRMQRRRVLERKETGKTAAQPPPLGLPVARNARKATAARVFLVSMERRQRLPVRRQYARRTDASNARHKPRRACRPRAVFVYLVRRTLGNVRPFCCVIHNNSLMMILYNYLTRVKT